MTRDRLLRLFSDGCCHSAEDMKYSGDEIYRKNSDDEEQIQELQREIERRKRLIAERKHEPICDEGEIVSFADWESRHH